MSFKLCRRSCQDTAMSSTWLPEQRIRISSGVKVINTGSTYRNWRLIWEFKPM